MKYFYPIFLYSLSLTIYGQPNCDEANSYLVNAYSHVKDAYDSNNVSHLKYYANRSVESFKLSKNTLTNCNCETALNLADKAIDLLVKVKDVETFEDGRFYVKRARDISKESVIEVDKCSINTNDNINDEKDKLSDLKQEQLKLKQQQEILKRKEEEIKTKLAQQKEKELTLKKQQLILSYKSTIVANIKTYNETLKIYNCYYDTTIKDNEFTEGISTKSIDDIKNYYKNKLKTLASSYLAQLNACN